MQHIYIYISYISMKYFYAEIKNTITKENKKN